MKTATDPGTRIDLRSRWFDRQLLRELAEEAGMIRRVLLVTVLLAMGCATSPEMKLRYEMVTEIYWDSARDCENRFPMLRIERVDVEGDVTLNIEGLQTQDVPRFTDCYWQGIGQRVERRRQANLPLPDPFNLKPSVEFALGD